MRLVPLGGHDAMPEVLPGDRSTAVPRAEPRGPVFRAGLPGVGCSARVVEQPDFRGVAGKLHRAVQAGLLAELGPEIIYGIAAQAELGRDFLRAQARGNMAE